MNNKYSDKFQASNYDDGAPCIIGLFDQSIMKESCVTVFESLLLRLIKIGQAYELHILSFLDIHNDTYLNAVQCENLIDELNFISQIINDDLLQQQIKQILKPANECVKYGGKYQLMIGGN